MSHKTTVLNISGVKKHFPITKGVFRRVVGYVKAVDDVSFSVHRGETLGLVGESGCGKTTLGRSILKLVEPSAGRIEFLRDGQMEDISGYTRRQMKPLRQEMQVIFQDPFSSLAPRMSVREIVSEPMVINGIGTNAERTRRVEDLLEKVGLRAYQMNRYPHEFSGGQRQRISIARALVLNPKFIVCDEPVSALDVSVQAQVLNVLKNLQREMDLTYLFIAHDLSVIEHISNRIAVMYLGKIVEVADGSQIYRKPQHPYTEALLASIPNPNPRLRGRLTPLKGDVPDPADPPQGCNFQNRCPYAQEICREQEPGLTAPEGLSETWAACHFVNDLELSAFHVSDTDETLDIQR